MTPTDVPYFYAPALRMKTGELSGLAALAQDVASRVLPRFVLLPPNEKHSELQTELFGDQAIPALAPALGLFWPNRRALIDFRLLTEHFGEEEKNYWLPRMFELARANRGRPVPLVGLDGFAGIRECIDEHETLKLAVRITLADLENSALIDELRRSLDGLKAAPNECCVIADFDSADFTQPELLVDIVEASLERLHEVGLWQLTVFQGTNYPRKNPADPSSTYMVPRNEWAAWRRAVQLSPSTPLSLVFGDYAADCAEFPIGKKVAKAVRHYRYTTDTHWLVVRASDKGDDKPRMKDVCSRIVSSGTFAGRSFSAADNFIFLNSVDQAGPGTATSWRAHNTNHHVTHVVKRIGATRSIKFADLQVGHVAEQVQIDWNE
jgi:hypothetical protein